MRVSVLLVSVVGLLGCASGPHEVGSLALFEGDFRPTGEVALAGRIPLVDTQASGATFNQERIVGPNVDVSRRSDGTWAGRIYDEPVTIDAAGTQISGANLTARISREGRQLVVGGVWGNGPIRIVINPQEIRVATPRGAFTLPNTGPGSYGDQQQLQLSGEAAEVLAAPQPQLAVALLATI